jgi:RNA polymerase sigma factor (sigma-70 family)
VILSRDPLASAESLIRRVYAYVAYRIGDGPDAEDVTSETFERAVRYRRSYDGSKGEPIEWLIGIARRVIAGLSGLPEISMEELPEIPSPESVENRVVTGMILRSAVARLDERDRELIALRYGADLSIREIGELLDLRANTVEVALHRARGRLASKLEAASDESWPDSGSAAVSIHTWTPVSLDERRSQKKEGNLA